MLDRGGLSDGLVSNFAWASSMRAFNAPGENPPNTTLCIAPNRAHANIATAASGIIGNWIATRSPSTTPNSVNALAALQTSRCRSA